VARSRAHGAPGRGDGRTLVGEDRGAAGAEGAVWFAAGGYDRDVLAGGRSTRRRTHRGRAPGRSPHPLRVWARVGGGGVGPAAALGDRAHAYSRGAAAFALWWTGWGVRTIRARDRF